MKFYRSASLQFNFFIRFLLLPNRLLLLFDILVLQAKHPAEIKVNCQHSKGEETIQNLMTISLVFTVLSLPLLLNFLYEFVFAPLQTPAWAACDDNNKLFVKHILTLFLGSRD